MQLYNPFLVYCRELAPGTVSLTGDRAQGEDSKHDLHFSPYSTLMTMYLPEASSTMRVLAGAHCTDATLYTFLVKIGTRTTSAREHSCC